VEHLLVPHLREFYGDSLEKFDNPLLTRVWPRNLNFVAEAEEVIATQIVKPAAAGSFLPTPRASAVRAFVAAGPTSQIYWNPKTVKSAIVTCGGLCPGLNTVVREIVMALNYVYGVSPGSVFGVQNGFRGFYELPWKTLTPDSVSAIHRQGGTVLGSSRGGFDLERILASLVEKEVGIVFIIGGDGTHRGALALLKGASARGMKLTVACVPKTIDNDIAIVDRTFGFDTAVQEAVRPIECAHTEARASQNGVGLVKLMGRASGFIALTASMASRDVNVTLLPEAPWKLASLLEYLETRLERRGHCLIVVAEGAESVEQKEAKASNAGKVRMDESGNVLPDDVGVYIKDAITAHFKRINTPCTVKYIDPSYIIRFVRAPPTRAAPPLTLAPLYPQLLAAQLGRLQPVHLPRLQRRPWRLLRPHGLHRRHRGERLRVAAHHRALLAAPPHCGHHEPHVRAPLHHDGAAKPGVTPPRV
jgi:6-phosphofructokinase